MVGALEAFQHRGAVGETVMKSKQQGLVYLVDVGGSSLKANVARTDEALMCFVLDKLCP